MSAAADDPYRTTQDVAERYHVATGTVLNWSYQGIMPPPTKVGRRLLWRESQLEEWARERSSTGDGAA
jgi:predicted site-specific integrase-resolvase